MEKSVENDQNVMCSCPCHEYNTDEFQKKCYACDGTGQKTIRRKGSA